MSEKPKPPHDEPILAHSYDGIVEYDNPMPGWWLWSFIASIVWAAVYFIGFHLDFVPRYDEVLAAEMAEQDKLEAKFAAATPAITAEVLAAAAADPARVESGHAVFTMNCAACHGQKGEGMIGPNLTDTAWLYGPKLTDIQKIVTDGTSNGMPAWGKILVPEDLVSVLAYVDSLRGTNPANPKAPQGEVYEAAVEDGAVEAAEANNG